MKPMKKIKQMKKSLAIFCMLLVMVFSFTACMEALLEEDEYEECYPEGYGEEWCSPEGDYADGYADDGYGYDGWYNPGDSYGYNEYGYGDGYGYDGYGYGDGYDSYGYGEDYGDDWTGYYDGNGTYDFEGGEHEYPYEKNLGTAKELEGDIAIVSIFVNDASTSWDFTKTADQKLNDTIYSNLSIAVDYLEKNCRDYGKNVNFIYDWNKYPELVYEINLNADYRTIDRDYYQFDSDVFQAIENEIPTETILKDLNTSQVIYMMFFNTPMSNQVTSCTRNYYQGMIRPYEICYMLMNCNGYTDCPANFAHEILHAFGAPDLYSADDYGITKEYVEYAKRTGLNDIMRINEDPNTGEYLYDRIANEITDITAYYAGLTDYSETVDEWGFEKSQH